MFRKVCAAADLPNFSIQHESSPFLEDGFTNPTPPLSPLAPGEPNPLEKSQASFLEYPSKQLDAKAALFMAWKDSRAVRGLSPYQNTLEEAPARHLACRDSLGAVRHGLNFASQDYLSLSNDLRVNEAVKSAVDQYGVHSAGSAALQGNTTLSRKLEKDLAAILNMKEVLLYPTGWAAGFGVITGLVRKTDYIILDAYAHNCLVSGAASATEKVSRVRHLDLAAHERALKRIRLSDQSNGIAVVTESLFSMDADSPDLEALLSLCKMYDATLIIDVAHDFGSMSGGFGRIGEQGLVGRLDGAIVVGTFSKTFASNGGFIATNSKSIKEYLVSYSPSHTFSNALGPPQCAAVSRCLEIVFSQEGEQRRIANHAVAERLRSSLKALGVDCLGRPSPIVPVHVGGEALARLAARRCLQANLFCNLVEFPAVSAGRARFRMQIMSSHTMEDADTASRTIALALHCASADKVAMEGANH